MKGYNAPIKGPSGGGGLLNLNPSLSPSLSHSLTLSLCLSLSLARCGSLSLRAPLSSINTSTSPLSPDKRTIIGYLKNFNNFKTYWLAPPTPPSNLLPPPLPPPPPPPPRAPSLTYRWHDSEPFFSLQDDVFFKSIKR